MKSGSNRSSGSLSARVRVLYIDIDCLRPDHLGCYGYHRKTSPNIDDLANRGVRFENVYVSDAPCLPSRSALFSQRFGLRTGVVNHGGARATPYNDGRERGFGDSFGRTSWMRAFRDAGFYTASVSPFAERHAAWHFYSGFREIINTGKRGLETADEIFTSADKWLEERGKEDSWFLHVNLWDPHTPYRTPDKFTNPFADADLPEWLSDDVLKEHRALPGPHSAQESMGFDDESAKWAKKYPRQPFSISDRADIRKMFDGYDAGVAYADMFCGRLLQKLDDLGIREDTAILLSADHGENLGELNVYGDHQTADQFTCRVPAILVVPGVTDPLAGKTDSRLHYQVDIGATLLELCGGDTFDSWDSESFSKEFSSSALEVGSQGGRDSLVLSQGAWACQRGVRFEADGDSWIWIRTLHDAFHGYPEEMLFNLTQDPHQLMNLEASHKEHCEQGRAILAGWLASGKNENGNRDPISEVLAEGGPYHVRGKLLPYVERLKSTGRGKWAIELLAKHPQEKARD